MQHVTVIQHTQSEFLGLVEDHLEGRGIRFSYVRPFLGGAALPVPELLGDGLILLGGGPFGAASAAHRLPWLEAEVRLARACLMLEKPVVGFGLGAQVLSLAADGGVDEAPYVFAVGSGSRAVADALNGYLPERFPVVTCMRDRPVPPAYAKILGVDEAGAPVIFELGPKALGFAGHPGIKPAMIEDLVMEFETAPDGDLASGLEQLRDLRRPIEDALVPIMTGLVQAMGWMAAR
jgi:GMP synthase-like glutamine amidotransferase